MKKPSQPKLKAPRLRQTKTIAPRLASGDKRQGIGHGLPPHIKDGLRSIAHQENKSLSWILEQVIIDYFDLTRPEYIPVKKHQQQQQKQEAPNESDARARAISHRSGREVSH